MYIYTDYDTVILLNNKNIDTDFWYDLKDEDLEEAIEEYVRDSTDFFEWSD